MEPKKKPGMETGHKGLFMSKQANDNATPPTLANLKISEGWKLVKHGLHLIGCGLAEQCKEGKSWT